MSNFGGFIWEGIFEYSVFLKAWKFFFGIIFEGVRLFERGVFGRGKFVANFRFFLQGGFSIGIPPPGVSSFQMGYFWNGKIFFCEGDFCTFFIILGRGRPVYPFWGKEGPHFSSAEKEI